MGRCGTITGPSTQVQVFSKKPPNALVRFQHTARYGRPHSRRAVSPRGATPENLPAPNRNRTVRRRLVWWGSSPRGGSACRVHRGGGGGFANSAAACRVLLLFLSLSSLSSTPLLLRFQARLRFGCALRLLAAA